jgi:dipeptidase E
MIILTSCLDLYDKDENGNRIAHHFGNENGILSLLKNNIKKYDNFLFVASVEDDSIATDLYAGVTFESFESTLPFKRYKVLDGRTMHDAKKLVEEADFIFLCGGHLPTQNKFFNHINLRELMQNTNALILGGSAGSMNCADIVYCPPEVEGESLDPNFNRYLKGLGLTNINILPHYDKFNGHVLDGKDYMKDIIYPDSYKKDILLINDGSYIVCDNGEETIYGEAYLLKNGEIIQVCENDKSVELLKDNTLLP